MAKALAPIGVSFEPVNPVTSLMVDQSTGEMQKEVLNEFVLSAIIELKTTPDKLSRLVPTILSVAKELDTVVSWEIVTRYADDGSIPVLPELAALGLNPRPNAKINLGMGSPLVGD